MILRSYVQRHAREQVRRYGEKLNGGAPSRHHIDDSATVSRMDAAVQNMEKDIVVISPVAENGHHGYGKRAGIVVVGGEHDMHGIIHVVSPFAGTE